MRYRARILGGALRIDSDPTEGTIVCCDMPIRASKPEMAAP